MIKYDKLWETMKEKGITQYDLLVVPGADFGAPGHMRISYCVKTETIERALPLFERLAKEYH